MTNVSRRILLAGLLLLAPVLPRATAADTIRRPTAASEVWARTELYFGTNRPDNTQVTEAEFTNFVDAEVTPQFPEGLTLLTGYGQFLSSTGVLVRERSYVLILLYPPQAIDANKKIQQIRDRYKQMFRQESVLRVDSFSFVSF